MPANNEWPPNMQHNLIASVRRSICFIYLHFQRFLLRVGAESSHLPRERASYREWPLAIYHNDVNLLLCGITACSWLHVLVTRRSNWRHPLLLFREQRLHN